MVYLLLADGFETVEALAPADILRRGGAELKLVSLDGKPVTSSHGIEVKAEWPISRASAEDAEMVILPGGGRGVENLQRSPAVLQLVREAYERGAYVAAICAAPVILADMGLLKGRQAVCFPDSHLDGAFVESLKAGGAAYQETAGVITDGPVITAKAAGVSLDFGLTLLELLKGPEIAEKVKHSMHYNTP